MAIDENKQVSSHGISHNNNQAGKLQSMGKTIFISMPYFVIIIQIFFKGVGGSQFFFINTMCLISDFSFIDAYILITD